MLQIIVIVFCILLYAYGKRRHDYWKKKGVKFEKPVTFLGNIHQPFLNKKTLSRYYASVYYKYPSESYVGIFNMNTPALVLREPRIIKAVMVADFKYFCNRGIMKIEHKDDVLMQNLFTCDGALWKILRPQLTTAFSSAKLKAMFPHVVDRLCKLVEIVDGISHEEVDAKELMARYTTDFIGTCVFGLNIDALNDKNSEFRRIGDRICVVTKRDIIVRILRECAPKMTKNLKFWVPEIERFFISLVKRVMAIRHGQPKRNDFIDTMLEFRQKGKIGDSTDKYKTDGLEPSPVELNITEELLAAQMFVFFGAGCETSSTASSYLLHNLAFHLEIQNKCQREIDQVLKKYDGKFYYEAIQDMKYLEMAMRESMRMLPPVGFIIRQCVKQYTFTDTNLTIDEGTQILIPLEALHNDEKYFECPHEFRPSRISSDNIEKHTKFVYMPFGGGPRNCIGARMGLMQSLAGVAAILSKYTVTPSKNSVRIPKVDPTSFLIHTFIGGLPICLQRRSFA